MKSTFTGAAGAAVTFGIGTAAGELFANFYSQAAAYGTFQGSMTAISGGKFWGCFTTGILCSIASSMWGGGDTVTDNGNYTMSLTKYAGLRAGTGDLGMIDFGTVSVIVGASLIGEIFDKKL
ncbi:hypothetical protein [Flavobacterium sp. T12S277]|uniref:hypothetical protein n=1 Tax=Flavobacterium sp. T12S277 TaxID=3402752 RepID=UPI003AE28D88